MKYIKIVELLLTSLARQYIGVLQKQYCKAPLTEATNLMSVIKLFYIYIIY